MPFALVLSILKELILLPVGTMGSFLLEDHPFKTEGACELCLRWRTLRTRPPRLPRFILVVSSSDTFLVVSTLDSLTLSFAVVLSVLKGLSDELE